MRGVWGGSDVAKDRRNQELLGGGPRNQLWERQRRKVESRASRGLWARPSHRAANPVCAQGASEGSHTAIFKPDKKRACQIVSSVAANVGFAQARPD